MWHDIQFLYMTSQHEAVHYEDPWVYSLKTDKNSIKSNAHRGGSFLAVADIWHDYFQLFS